MHCYTLPKKKKKNLLCFSGFLSSPALQNDQFMPYISSHINIHSFTLNDTWWYCLIFHWGNESLDKTTWSFSCKICFLPISCGVHTISLNDLLFPQTHQMSFKLKDGALIIPLYTKCYMFVSFCFSCLEFKEQLLVKAFLDWIIYDLLLLMPPISIPLSYLIIFIVYSNYMKLSYN